MVPIPELDQGHEDFPNVTAVVTAAKDGQYKLDTKHGVSQQMYSSNPIMPCTESVLSVDVLMLHKMEK